MSEQQTTVLMRQRLNRPPTEEEVKQIQRIWNMVNASVMGDQEFRKNNPSACLEAPDFARNLLRDSGMVELTIHSCTTLTSLNALQTKLDNIYPGSDAKIDASNPDPKRASRLIIVIPLAAALDSTGDGLPYPLTGMMVTLLIVVFLLAAIVFGMMYGNRLGLSVS